MPQPKTNVDKANQFLAIQYNSSILSPNIMLRQERVLKSVNLKHSSLGKDQKIITRNIRTKSDFKTEF